MNMKLPGKHINISFIILLSLTAIKGQEIVINEVQYKNTNTLYDHQQNTPDWIELYNYGETNVNLESFQLSDDKDLKDFWTFPQIEIRPKEYIIVFASGKNKISDDEIHADFNLKLMEDPLLLLNNKGEIIDKIETQCVPPDKSFGCYPDGSVIKVLQSPSPGESNNNSETVTIDYKPDTLIISHQSGFYDDDILVDLQNKQEENYIVYTLDANDPDFDSPVYTSSFLLTDINNDKNRFADKGDLEYHPGNLISKANILRACVYSEGCPASNEISNIYFISNNQAFNYHVPVISLITDKDNLFDDDIGIYTSGNNYNYDKHGKKWERPVSLEIFDKNRVQITKQEAGVRIHGRGSRGGPQKSLRLYARSEYGKSSFDYHFFSQKPDINLFQTLLLRNTRGWSGTLFKDELCQYLVQNMNIDYTASETTVLFINGEYWGIYSFRERQDEYYVSSNYEIPDPELDIIGYDKLNIIVESGDINAYDELIESIEKYDPESSVFYQKISEEIDLDALTDFFIAQLYLANIDFPNNNFELWRIRNDTSKWRFFFFDLDGAMIRVNYNHLSEYNNTYEDFQRFEEYSTKIFRNLIQNNDYRNYFNARFYHHLSTTFSPARIITAIDSFQTLYEPLVSEHIYRWGNPADYNKWLHNVDMLRLFAIQRPAFIHEQLLKNFGNPFLVYPNPSDGNFYIDFLYDDNLPKELCIADVYGRIIFTETISEKQKHMEMNLDTGMYILRIEIENLVFTQKIQVMK